MKIASYNLNNLFERASVFQLEGFSSIAAEVLDDIKSINTLLENEIYTSEIKKSLEELLSKYLKKGSGKKNFFTVIQVRGKLYAEKKDKSGVIIIAKGKKDWLGWIEVLKTSVNEQSTSSTALVIDSVKPDILCVVEVESRRALQNFNSGFLKKKLKYSLVIDGNDNRGINVGMMSRYPITNIKTHIFDQYKTSSNVSSEIFSRDCVEYEISITLDQKIFLLCNHFKSMGYGTDKANKAKRLVQATRVAEILKNYDLTTQFVAVLGDFNDIPDSSSMAPLINYPGLESIFKIIEGPVGTYSNTKLNIDNMFVSTALFQKIKSAGIERRGIFNNGVIAPFAEVTSAKNQASDHAAIWADFDI
jgi:endonuclease/exonuclease/phosphatase family metal-dependent hydrolase